MKWTVCCRIVTNGSVEVEAPGDGVFTDYDGAMLIEISRYGEED